jgi:CheY-like chemotaxis protein
MQAYEIAPVLIIDDDPATRRRLLMLLAEEGYVVREAVDAEEGLGTLRGSPQRMLVLFNVSLFDNVMSGLDCARLLGVIAEDTHLAERHAYVVITPSPYNVSMALGKLLDRLAVPVVATPFNRDELLCTVTLAAERLLAVPA